MGGRVAVALRANGCCSKLRYPPPRPATDVAGSGCDARLRGLDWIYFLTFISAYPENR